ncbi:hypothetical protein [Halocalculus aciditolerans]|uniref:Uncharacterized protein n=1 Tax=Halocalculus aciditolerans TaxID=1383812 RepID=A0A830FKN5_9EURY|nr:hypothetical protein [Halocalculus aciditolerans]GGL65641.1 hypothetical protein GCM10009039_24370 [Halocalculus aciditolerans]
MDSSTSETGSEKVGSRTVSVGGGQTAEVVGDKSVDPPELRVSSRGETWVYRIDGGTAVLVESTYDEPDWMPQVFSRLGLDAE